MKKDKKYNEQIATKKYDLITEDMVYNIVMNLKDNNYEQSKLSEELGITQEELLDLISQDHKDFFLCMESLILLQKQENFKDYSRIKSHTKK